MRKNLLLLVCLCLAASTFSLSAQSEKLDGKGAFYRNSFVGVGHNSEIITDKAGNDWMFYHGVSTNRPEGRVLMMDKVQWKDGWPVVDGNVPSTECDKPVF